jgi:threonine dehydratase
LTLYDHTQMNPNIKVIAVEPVYASSLSAALAAGGPVHHPITPTLADGLAVPQVGSNAFKLIQQHVDEVITVSEE